MNQTAASQGRFPRFASAVAIAVLLPLTMATGCPFSVDQFRPRCEKDSDCNDKVECTKDECVGGYCENTPKPKETACGKDSASVCDGDGKCVECVSNADCAANHPLLPVCDLAINECVSCTDGKKNGKEDDVDCGGPDCGACLGKACDPSLGPAACGNHTFCSPLDNICCTTPCDGKCEACVGDKTGEPDGTCAPIPYGTDPDQECAAQGACGAAPGKCRCEDGVKNADESDVDCGGATCARCGGGQMCGMASDCAANVAECVDGACCNSICELPCTHCDPVGQCVFVPAGFDDAFCGATKACGANGAGCVGKAGTACASGSQCLSGSCVAMKCAQGALGKPCTTNADCAAGTCNNYLCQ